MLENVGGTMGQFTGSDMFPQAGLPFSDIFGVAPTDIPQKLLFNYSLDVPVGRGRKLLSAPNGTGGAVLNGALGGWRVAGTTTMHSGTPLNVYVIGGGVGMPGSNWYNLGQGRTTRPIYTGGQPLGFTMNGHTALLGAADSQPYFNSAAFQMTSGMDIGNVPNMFPSWRGPGFTQWDLAVMKNFPLFSEHRSLPIPL